MKFGQLPGPIDLLEFLLGGFGNAGPVRAQRRVLFLPLPFILLL